MLGTILRGRYKIIKQLGSRRFCDTYLAKDEELPGQPLCVVKQLNPKNIEPLLGPTARQLFNTEAEVLYRLGKYDRVPQLLAQFEENKEAYLVQEFIAGNDFSQEVTPGRRWSEQQVITLLSELLEILVVIHEQNIIHRDVKPSNLIRRTQDGEIVLIDFGAAKQVTTQIVNDPETPIVNIGIGTSGYMPKEQAEGNPQFNSDIYATGIIGIQALTGTFPLPKADNTGEIIWRDRVQVSPKLAEVLDKMVHYDEQQRYQSATSALQALKDLQIHPAALPPQRRGGRNKVIPLILLFLASAAGIAATLRFSEFNKIVSRNDSTDSTDSTPQPPTKVTPKLVEFENTTERIKIAYPEDWRSEDIQNPLTGDIVRFLPPADTNSRLSIRIEKLSQPLSLAEYSNSSVREIKNFLKNAKIIESSSTTLANRPGHMVVYSGKDSQSNLNEHLEVWTLKNNKAYVISYAAKPGEYEKYLNTARAMIKSFEVND